jgi:hypothetical protein
MTSNADALERVACLTYQTHYQRVQHGYRELLKQYTALRVLT